MVVNSFACRARNYLGRHPSPPTARISIFGIFNQMMRKTILHGTRHVVTTLLLAAAFLSLAQPSDAVPITRKQAEQRAAKFFHKRMARRAAPVQLSLALEKPTDATSAGYYIYNKVGGGYAIVSADDTQAAIIGFSDSGHLESLTIGQSQRMRSLFLSRMQFRRVG